MKATEAKLLDFLKKSPQFVIPIYPEESGQGQIKLLLSETDKTSLIAILDQRSAAKGSSGIAAESTTNRPGLMEEERIIEILPLLSTAPQERLELTLISKLSRLLADKDGS